MRFLGTRLVHRTKIRNADDLLKLSVVELASVIDAIVFFASFSFITLDLRAAIVFSDWWLGDE